MTNNTPKIKCTGIIGKGNLTAGEFELFPNALFDYLQLELINHTDLVVYMKLHQFYNKELGYAFPTIPQLMTYTRVGSKATIQRSLKSLESAGLIQRSRTNRGNNIYVVYKPLGKAELYECVPDKVEKFKEREANFLNMAVLDKERFHQHMLERQEQELWLTLIENTGITAFLE